MRKRKIKPSKLLEMVGNDMPSQIGARRYFSFHMPLPDDERDQSHGYHPRRSRCNGCKIMIQLNDIRVQTFNPAGNSYERTKNYHFRPCFAYILSKFINDLDDNIRTVVRFREKYNLPNK